MKAEQTGCDSSSDLYDVVICGGGLAGQTLARQLKLTLPQLSILILEQEHFPRPLAACKVGESTIETSSFYLGEVLQLREHLKQEHLRKLGLRYFWSDPHRSLAEVPEIGLSQATPYPSYQIDRGVLENHLYETNCAMGVVVSTGVQGKEISLGDQETLHQIHIDYLSLPFLRDLYRRSVARYDDFTQVVANYHVAVQKIEEIIQVIFLLALRDVMPEAIAHLPNPLWLNPLGMSLEPARWQSDGLFRPTTAPRDFRELRAEIEALYTFSSADGEAGEMIIL